MYADLTRRRYRLNMNREIPTTVAWSTESTVLSFLRGRLREYCTLTKPEVNLLILITTSAGYILGNHGPIHFVRLLHTLAGTLLVASGTATLNQLMESRHDGQMHRTANRPLPAGRIHPWEALSLGILLSVAGSIYLWTAVNAVASLAAMFTLLSYLLVYTPLKRRTSLCTLLGAIPGAMPTAIGWLAASGRLDLKAGILFSLLFLWQFPHFLSIALMYREDYERAGYRMLPSFDVEGRFTRLEIVLFALAVIIISILFVGTDPAPSLPIVGLLALGGLLLHSSLQLARSASRLAAARLLHATVLYLPGILAILIWNKY